MGAPKKLTRALARKVLTTVDAGLVKGLGSNVPGQMCVEAAVCFAYGLPHNDNPPCVGASVREYKINLNDQPWASNAARAEGMRALAIAQLGSAEIDQDEFCAMLQEGTIRVIVPMALRAAASVPSNSALWAELLAAADECEQTGTPESARKARAAAADATHAAADATYATYAAARAANAAARAANAAAAANADAADATYATYAATYATYAAARAAAAADEVRRASADVALQCLYALGSPGCEYLDLL